MRKLSDFGPKDLTNIDFQRKTFDMYRICGQNIRKVSDLRPKHSKNLNFYAKHLKQHRNFSQNIQKHRNFILNIEEVFRSQYLKGAFFRNGMPFR